VVPSIAAKGGSIMLGDSLLLKIIDGMIFKNIPPNSDIFLHPVAFAGWVGLLVTALNLFPMGQLDGGHVSYAILGSKSRNLARIFMAFFFVLGIFFWVGWFLWAILILFMGMRHPAIEDEAEPLSQGRKIIAYVIVLIFILSFIPDPIKGYGLVDLLRELWLFK
jgi:membrane-associated protease RseP (regulator of RpoE activity)